MELPKTTLFMLMSLDGKVSTGVGDERDFDKDLPQVSGIADGLNQYYELEKQTDLFSFNTGKVMAKVGWNEQKNKSIPVSFVLVDNKPHLTSRGLSNLVASLKKVYVVTTNGQHPAIGLANDKLEVIQYKDQIDFFDLFKKLRKKGVNALTVQSGGEMNASLLRAGLVNFISVVVAPVIVGGREAPTLVDGSSLETIADLAKLKTLKLIAAKTLSNSYLHLKYEVLRDR